MTIQTRHRSPRYNKLIVSVDEHDKEASESQYLLYVKIIPGRTAGTMIYEDKWDGFRFEYPSFLQAPTKAPYVPRPRGKVMRSCSFSALTI